MFSFKDALVNQAWDKTEQQCDGGVQFRMFGLRRLCGPTTKCTLFTYVYEKILIYFIISEVFSTSVFTGLKFRLSNSKPSKSGACLFGIELNNMPTAGK